jgi:tryptophan synthase alpha chain
MNRLNKLFSEKKENILSIYFSAGHPQLNDTVKIIEALDKSGADIVEVGMPFSDPVADGPVIQQSSLKALQNGMSVELLFQQLENIREVTNMPIVLMGYLNPVLQYGIEDFCKKCNSIGIDGLILPDLPPDLYLESYKNLFEEYKLSNVLLVPPQTSDERIKELDNLTTGFLYIVAASSTTGSKQGFQEYQIKYFNRLQELNLQSPTLIGFGISSHDSFTEACKYANGAIIGSAFIKALEGDDSLDSKINSFMSEILENN